MLQLQLFWKPQEQSVAYPSMDLHHIDLPGVNVAGNQDTTGNAATATDASQLGGNTGAYYLNYANFTNVPALVDSLGQGTLVVSDLANDANYATTSYVTTQINNIDNLETAGGAMSGFLSLHADPDLWIFTLRRSVMSITKTTCWSASLVPSCLVIWY